MPRVYVQFSSLSQIGNRCKSVASKTEDIRSDFQNVVRKLDWDIKYEENVNSTATKIAGRLEKHKTSLKKYQSFIEDALKEYRRLDNGEIDSELWNPAPQVENANSTQNSDPNPDKQFFEWLKSLLKWADKTDSSDQAGLIGDGLSYLDTLYKFFNGDMKGLTGAEAWLDLCDGSVELWTEFYDYLKDFYHKTGDLFSVENRTKVGGISVVGDILGFIGSICGAADRISSTEDMGAAGIIGEIIGTLDGGVDIWESVDKMLNVADDSQGGVYSPLKFYTTIAKGYLSTFSQAFESIEEYSTDGAWDWGDTAATGIEASVSGLYSMVESLTFGLVSEGTTGVSADDISTALEDWSGNIGVEAGQYIAADPALQQMYQETNLVGKVFLTFYAVAKTC